MKALAVYLVEAVQAGEPMAVKSEGSPCRSRSNRPVAGRLF